MTAEPLVVVCAGDRFIGSDALAAAARRTWGEETVTRGLDSDWPDEPFGPVDGVREASGPPAALAALVRDADVLLTHLAPVTAEVLEAGSRLRVVGVTRGGPVNVDLDAARARGIEVVHLPGRNLNAVAEYTVGLMIALPRNVLPAARTLARGEWDASWYRRDRVGPELASASVGLVGLGAIGMRVADLLAAFGSRLSAYDPYADAGEAAAHGVTLLDSLQVLLAGVDIVSVHARLTEETRMLIDASALRSIRHGAYLINTARGELVDQTAVADALSSGQLAGAALDVFHPEPPDPDDPLFARDDVLATPHLAGASRQVADQSVERIVALVAARLAGPNGVDRHLAGPGGVAGDVPSGPGSEAVRA